MKITRMIADSLSVFSFRQKAVLFILIFLAGAAGIIFPLLLSANPAFVLNISREYRAGELSDEDVIAPEDFSYVDEVATNDAVRRAAESILPQFSYSVSASIAIRTRFNEFSQAYASGTLSSLFREDSTEIDSDAIDKLKSLSGDEAAMILSLASDCLTELVSGGIFSDDGIHAAREGGYSSIELEPSGVPFRNAGKIIDIEDAVVVSDLYRFVIGWVSDIHPDTESGNADLIADIIAMNAVHNVDYDSVLTVAMRENAAETVPPVLVEVEEGDYIMRRDTIVTDQQLRTIERMRENAVVSVPPARAFVYLVYIAAFIMMTVLMLFFFIQYRYRLFLYLTIFLSGIIITLTLSYFIVLILATDGVRYADPFLPFLFLPLFATAVTGRKRIGFSLGLLLAGCAVIYPGSRSFTFFYLIVGMVLSMLFMRSGNERMDIIYQTLFSSISVAVVTLLVSMIYSQPYSVIMSSVLVSMINVVLSFILLSIVLPIAEKIFNVPTSYRLHELSFTDTPTLNRLSQVAPGTFNHSKNVAEMAYDACKAIGANAELARVGGLYHDVGKAEHPEYFIENQNGKNVHDEINKTLSAAIIKSHVKLGVEKAKEIGLPQEVIDIISEHHGNDLIKYFYNEAVREAKDRALVVSEEDFRYTGRIPATPESAVVMLADCSEAATRTLKNPNHQKYEKLINSIIIDKMNYKQLNNSQLTINDLDKIKEAFILYLMGRDHQRIEYEKD